MVSEHGISQLRTLRAARSFNVFLPPCPLPAVASNQRYLWYYLDTGRTRERFSCSITTFLAVLRCESGGVPRRISSSAFSRRVAEPRRYWSREPRRRAALPHHLYSSFWLFTETCGMSTPSVSAPPSHLPRRGRQSTVSPPKGSLSEGAGAQRLRESLRNPTRKREEPNMRRYSGLMHEWSTGQPERRI